MKPHPVILSLQEMNPKMRNLVTVTISAIVATFIFLLSTKIINDGANKQFEHDSEAIQANILSLVKRHEQTLYSVNSFIVSNNELTKKQFDKYLDTLKISEDYPSMGKIHFAQLVKAYELNEFYDQIKDDYAEMGLLTNKLANQLDLYKNNIDLSQVDHYLVRYIRGDNNLRFIGMEVPKNNYDYFSQIKLNDNLLKTDSYTPFRDEDNKGSILALNLPSYKELESNNINSYGSTGAVIKLNDNFFSPAKQGLNYINFQINSATDLSTIYTSLVKEEARSKLFLDTGTQFSKATEFLIGQNKYILHTFSTRFPPNVGTSDIAYLFTVLAFLGTFFFVHLAIFRKIDQTSFSHKVTKQVFALATQANTDQLTGLFNRRYFFSDVTTKIVEQPKNKMFLFFIDLDGFKNINDSLGHSAGDELLQQYTARLQAIEAIKSFTAYRIGGDEFLVLVEQTHYSRPLSAEDIKEFADSLLRLTDDPFIIKEEKCYLSQSIGIAEYPSDGSTPEDLFKNSDMAMYHAKKMGKNCYVLYSDELSAQIKEKNHMLALLVKSIEKDGFYLEFQPKMIKVDGAYKLYGAEALMRWKTESLGNVSPAVFIPLAEEAGLMSKIDNWLIHEVGRSFQQWNAQGLKNMTLSINVSARQFSNDGLPDFFKTVLEYYGVQPQNIIIEITESATVKEPDKARKILEKFRSYGFGVSIDDFGTGYSSINYLRQFPATEIKIDKSFTDDIMIDEHDRIIIEGIADMSRKLKLCVVMEGVESLEQVQWIEKSLQNSIIIQGYFFSKPLAMKNFIEFSKVYS